ncbi:hypothetical protein VTK56DRAFT_1201 [Thermocarpiscus australiensis]
MAIFTTLRSLCLFLLAAHAAAQYAVPTRQSFPDSRPPADDDTSPGTASIAATTTTTMATTTRRRLEKRPSPVPGCTFTKRIPMPLSGLPAAAASRNTASASSADQAPAPTQTITSSVDCQGCDAVEVKTVTYNPPRIGGPGWRGRPFPPVPLPRAGTETVCACMTSPAPAPAPTTPVPVTRGAEFDPASPRRTLPVEPTAVSA